MLRVVSVLARVMVTVMFSLLAGPFGVRVNGRRCCIVAYRRITVCADGPRRVWTWTRVPLTVARHILVLPGAMFELEGVWRQPIGQMYWWWDELSRLSGKQNKGTYKTASLRCSKGLEASYVGAWRNQADRGGLGQRQRRFGHWRSEAREGHLPYSDYETQQNRD